MKILNSSPHKITLLAPAKINLTLEVLKKRKNRFHELRSIITSIPLFDKVKVSLEKEKSPSNSNSTSKSKIPKIIITSNNPRLPLDKKNNAYQAAELILKKFPKQIPPDIQVKIDINKNIPLAGGLGGSSTNTAAVIIALNTLLKLKLTQKQQLKLMGELSSEGASLVQGTVFVSGRGEKVISMTKSYLNLPLILIKSNQKTTTKETFKNYASSIDRDKRFNASRKLASVIQKISKRSQSINPAKIVPYLINDLESAKNIDKNVLCQTKQALKATGALGTLMSGAGSTIYGIYPNNYTLKRASETLKKHYSILTIPQCLS